MKTALSKTEIPRLKILKICITILVKKVECRGISEKMAEYERKSGAKTSLSQT